jgi:hypothetical protein
MSKINDGGPAFPAPWHPEMGCYWRDMPPGMSLRDWFAGMAAQGVLANQVFSDTDNVSLATWCYDFSDALIAERNKRRKT